MPSRLLPLLCRWSWAVLSLGVVATAQIGLVQLPADDRDFVVQQLSTAGLLPQNTVNAVVQTRDGYLWIGTSGGLCRYDGTDLMVFDPANSPGMRSNRVMTLLEGSDGTLWIGFDDAGVCRFAQGRFTACDDVPPVLVSRIGEDGAGRIVVASKQGLWRRDANKFHKLAVDCGATVEWLHRRGDGTLIACNARGLWRLDDRGAERIVEVAANCCIEADGGDLWIGGPEGLWRWNGAQCVPWRPIPALTSPVMCLLRTDDGALMVGTVSGPVRIAASELVHAEPLLAPAQIRLSTEIQTVNALCQDHEGGLWIGLTEHGLARLRPSELRGHGTESGLPMRGVTAVCGDARGGLYVGATQGLFHGSGRGFEQVAALAKFHSCRGLAVDPDGAVWCGTFDGLARLVDDTVRAFPLADCDGGVVRAIARDPDGSHWLGADAGLYRCANDVIEMPAVVAPLRGDPVRSLVFAADGALWIGTAHALARLSPDRATLRSWRSGTELPYGEVRAILPEAGEHAWIAVYSGGLVRIDGDVCATIDERRGLYDQSLCAVLAVGDHFVASSNRGFFVMRGADLRAAVDGRLQQIACRPLFCDRRMSPEGNGGVQPCAAAIGGRLWFCGIEGLLELDPARLEFASAPPACRIEEVVLGEQRSPVDESITAPLGVRTALFRLGALAFDYPQQTRFRWRLRGRDDAWSEPSYEREARFASLAPGDYVFEAEAVDLLGATSRAPARAQLLVPPRLWEQRSFQFAAVVATLAVSWLLLRFGARRSAHRALHLQRLVDDRTSELQRAQEQLEQRVVERTRDLQTAMQRQQEEMVERHRLERQLQQLQRMESLGQLAGGVAHDFNNLLTVVLGASELIASQNNQPLVQELLASIRLAGERGRGLTQHLLAVASRQMVEVELLDLDAVVVDLEPVLRSLLGENIALQITRSPAAPRIRAAVTQIEQILINVAANARDAMPRGGNLLIAIADCGAEVGLTVGDDGVGMPAEVVEHVFEPFYSTKQSGGRGLGMSTVYGIVKQIGGTVAVDSTVGRGTIVRFRFPAAVEPVGAPAPVAVPRLQSPELRGTVLLIEDQDDVRRVLRLMLERLGCRVCEAADGAAAVALLRAEPRAIDMVLSDVVMPGLHGRELVEALGAVRADLPIVFLSGYLDGKQTYQELLDLGLEILTKPPIAAEVALALQRARDRRAAQQS